MRNDKALPSHKKRYHFNEFRHTNYGFFVVRRTEDIWRRTVDKGFIVFDINARQYLEIFCHLILYII